jgi:REP element-mobilizing transposase RayT
MVSERRRRSLRLREHDYASPGAYFVTICTGDRVCAFGDMANEAVRLNGAGEIVRACWQAIPDHFPDARLDAFVVMPNHVHGIIVIDRTPRRGDARVAPGACVAPTQAQGPVADGLGAIIGSFKSAATRRINESRGTSGQTVWQRNYHEHIVRDEDELNRIRQYTTENPLRWGSDRENPAAIAANLKEPGCGG